MWCMTAAAKFCGHRGSPIMENGQFARMPAPSPCIMDAKLKITVARNSARMNAVTIFCSGVCMRYVIIIFLF